MALACLALQKAVYDALSGDATLATLVGAGKVFDYVPDGTAAPLVVIGDDGDAEIRSVEFSDVAEDAHEQVFTVHVWTESRRGRFAIKSVLSRLHDLLVDTALLLSGFAVLRQLFVSAQAMQEDDGLTYHGVFQFRVVTTAN